MLSRKVQALLTQQELTGYAVSAKQLKLDADSGTEPLLGRLPALLLYELPSRGHVKFSLENLIA